MPTNIMVRFEFPFSNCVFWGWLPLEEGDEIVVEEGKLSLTVQFPKRNVLSPPDREVRVSKQNNSFITIVAAVTVRDVPDDLVAGIHERASVRYATADSPRDLAQRVLKFVIARINRVISYARNIKGQYWLSEIEYDPGNLHAALRGYKCKVNVNDSGWVDWRPTHNEYVLSDGRRVNPDWCIHRADWQELRDFVAASKKPPLVNHLLAEAEWHAEQGHLRVALTEGVAALEAAIGVFKRTVDANRFQSLFSERVEAKSFSGLVKKFGLRGTVAVLLPVVFSEDTLPMELLSACKEAVTSRNEVIHQGQRSLDKNKVQRYVAAIRKMCVILTSGQERALEE